MLIAKNPLQVIISKSENVYICKGILIKGKVTLIMGKKYVGIKNVGPGRQLLGSDWPSLLPLGQR